MADLPDGLLIATKQSSWAPPERRSTESAATAWLASVVPTRSTLTGAPIPTLGSRATLASDTTTTVESLSRAASAEARAKASVRSPGSWVAPIRSMAALAAARSSVSETRTWAV